MFLPLALSGGLFTALSVDACNVDAYPKTPIRVRIRAEIQLNQ
jgi:hypothetical protein